jgi:bifunctional DNA-binding transcriptional regulator/antitoxin component of YhaV-PrlF toxin-antitoxin module
MPKWKKDAKEFTVSVTFHEMRGYQTVIPKPVAEHLSRPERVTFIIRRGRVEIKAFLK